VARLNVEESFFKDPALKVLEKKLKSRFKAIGCVIEFWHVAQEYWSRDQQLVPLEVFHSYGFPPELLESDFAEQREGGIYARGSTKQFAWLLAKKVSGSRGGKASGAKRRKNKELAEATAKQTRSKREANAKQNEASLLLTPYSLLTSIKDTTEKKDTTEFGPTENSVVPELSAVADILEGRKIKTSLQMEWLKIYTPEFMIKKIKELRIWELNAGAKGRKSNWGRFYSNCFAKDWDQWSKRLPAAKQELNPHREAYLKSIEEEANAKA
jgi:hypothetical protein